MADCNSLYNYIQYNYAYSRKHVTTHMHTHTCVRPMCIVIIRSSNCGDVYRPIFRYVLMHPRIHSSDSAHFGKRMTIVFYPPRTRLSILRRSSSWKITTREYGRIRRPFRISTSLHLLPITNTRSVESAAITYFASRSARMNIYASPFNTVFYSPTRSILHLTAALT